MLSITRNKKKKHDKILALVKNKVNSIETLVSINSIETLVSQALIDLVISHEDFIAILNEKDK